ncbi:hypothetical protein [Candidatus Nitrosotenuis uzonensis]|uniref:hypothetical protein n=1 Tax=Candidatus Nitrosotenuis uzonensis TaxID=1407055 RepID=UPI0019621228|nr:hypothetical protein [Candidatus Nitrosotenuis uzonensis]
MVIVDFYKKQAITHVLIITCSIFLSMTYVIVNAQDLSTNDPFLKTDSKLDSRLNDLLNNGILDNVHLENIDKIRIIIEFINSDYTIPSSLGLQIEITYENFVQAIIPIENISELTNNANVRKITLPNEPLENLVFLSEPTPIINYLERENLTYYLLLLIAAFVVILAIIYFKKRHA